MLKKQQRKHMIDNISRAQLGAKERWHPTTPKATHSGILVIGETELACDVLEDGRRILRQKTFVKAMGKANLGKYDHEKGKQLNLPVFLTANNLTPYLKDDFCKRGEVIEYKGVNGQRLKGYDATILPEVCKIYSQADDDKILQPSQVKIARVCRIMLYGLASVGIIALVDDATGYVEQRNRDELQKILENYISEELRKWTKRFPNEFFKQAYKIHGWDYSSFQKNHPQCLGNFINKYVYEQLPPGVIEELKSKNPQNENGRRKYRLHQFLTEDIGDDNLKKQITQVVTLMKVSTNLDEFKALVDKL